MSLSCALEEILYRQSSSAERQVSRLAIVVERVSQHEQNEGFHHPTSLLHAVS